MTAQIDLNRAKNREEIEDKEIIPGPFPGRREDPILNQFRNVSFLSKNMELILMKQGLTQSRQT